MPPKEDQSILTKDELEIVKNAIESAIRKFTATFLPKIFNKFKNPKTIAKTNRNGNKVCSDCKKAISKIIKIITLTLIFFSELPDLQFAFEQRLWQLALKF